MVQTMLNKTGRIVHLNWHTSRDRCKTQHIAPVPPQGSCVRTLPARGLRASNCWRSQNPRPACLALVASCSCIDNSVPTIIVQQQSTCPSQPPVTIEAAPLQLSTHLSLINGSYLPPTPLCLPCLIVSNHSPQITPEWSNRDALQSILRAAAALAVGAAELLSTLFVTRLHSSSSCSCCHTTRATAPSIYVPVAAGALAASAAPPAACTFSAVWPAAPSAAAAGAAGAVASGTPSALMLALSS